MIQSELPIGTLIYDRNINDYGIILKCSWTELSKPNYQYYLILWQNTPAYNINKESKFKWSATHLHDRISDGEVVVINDEEKNKKQDLNT